MSYARGTLVPVDKSRAELERMLRQAGCTRLGFGHDGPLGVVTFELGGRTIRLTISCPEEDPGGREERRLWRVLVLVTKAKLTAISEGLSDVEQEFLAAVVVKGGATVGELLRCQLEAMYSGDGSPSLRLLGAG